MPPFVKDGIAFVKANNIEYECFYNDTIIDKNLRDLTQYIAGPGFLIDPDNRQVHVRMWVDVNDTTDNVKYFRYSLQIFI